MMIYLMAVGLGGGPPSKPWPPRCIYCEAEIELLVAADFKVWVHIETQMTRCNPPGGPVTSRATPALGVRASQSPPPKRGRLRFRGRHGAGVQGGGDVPDRHLR